MKWKYKTILLLTLLIFCIGNVCATEPDNNNNNNNITDNVQIHTDIWGNKNVRTVQYLNTTQVNDTVKIDSYRYIETPFEIPDWLLPDAEKRYDKEFINIMKATPSRTIDKTNAHDINEWFLIGCLNGNVALYELAFNKENNITTTKGNGTIGTIIKNGAVIGSPIIVHNILKGISTYNNNKEIKKMRLNNDILHETEIKLQSESWDNFKKISNDYNIFVKGKGLCPLCKNHVNIENMIYIGEKQLEYINRVNIKPSLKQEYQNTVNYLKEVYEKNKVLPGDSIYQANLKDINKKRNTYNKAITALEKNNMRVVEANIEAAGISAILSAAIFLGQMLHAKIFMDNFDQKDVSTTDLYYYAKRYSDAFFETLI